MNLCERLKNILITKAQTEMKICYDSKLTKRSRVQLNIGDQVLIWNSRKEKLQPGTNVEDPWIGPAEVVKAKLHIVYIRKNNKIQRIKRKFIKKVTGSSVRKDKKIFSQDSGLDVGVQAV